MSRFFIKTQQEQAWQGQHGNEYNLRNPHFANDVDGLYLENYGITRSQLNKEFLDALPRDIKILEVGCNVAAQLHCLQEMGFINLLGCDINRQAIEIAKKNLVGIDVLMASAFDLPFKSNYFDLVFTSGVLIHINPKDIQKAMLEIARVSRKYIWGFEYFNQEYSEVLYRGKTNLLWKADFPQLYLKEIPGLKILREKKIQYLNSDNVDIMFLIKKLRVNGLTS